MSEPLGFPLLTGASSEEQDLFNQLVEWADGAGSERWKDAAADPAKRAEVVRAIRSIAQIPITQGEAGAAVQFVFKKRVFNLRPMVLPTIILILEKVSVTIVPGLDSALLPVLDLIGFAEKASEIYRKLTDDEVEVFGAVADLNRKSKSAPSVINPNVHPTADGVKAWFKEKGFEAPEGIDEILHSLVKKGALVKDEVCSGIILYEPSFLGKRKD